MGEAFQSHLSTGDRMRLSMKRSRLTTAEMAEHTGASSEQVAAWLSGKEPPGASVLRRWSQVTHASLSWLTEAPVTGSGEGDSPARRPRRYVRGSRRNRPET